MKSRFWAFAFSAVPGVGHLYLGQMQRGLWFCSSFFGLFALSTLLSLEPLNLLAPVIWFYSMFDALQNATRLRAGEDVPDNPPVPWNRMSLKAPIVGWGLVFVGLLGLVRNNLGFYHRSYMPAFLRHVNLDSFLVAAFLVGVGIHLLIRRRSHGAADEANS